MNIKISKIAHHCVACEVDFTHEQQLTSAVRVVEGALQREDFCAGCWKAEANKRAYSIWKTVYFDPKIESEEPPEVFSPLRQLFYEAVEEDSRVEMAKAFLAAGLLRRQKVFRLIKESDESDGEVRITLYADRIGNRMIEVPDPNFTHAEMEEASKRLLVRLQELETPEPEESDESPEEGPVDVAPNVESEASEELDEDTSEHGEEEDGIEGDDEDDVEDEEDDDVEDDEDDEDDDDEYDEDDDDDDEYEEDGDDDDEYDEDGDDDEDEEDEDGLMAGEAEDGADAEDGEPTLNDEEIAHAEA